mgnify:FL=1
MNNKFQIYGILLICILIIGGCGTTKPYAYKSNKIDGYKKPVATVEKAWLARHKYDHERRLLIPMVGGTRWGAIQEYKEDGTLEYRDWWVRDIKTEDLEPAPSTTLKIPKNQNIRKVTTLEGINLDNVPKPTLKNIHEDSKPVQEASDFIPLVPSLENNAEEKTAIEPGLFDSAPVLPEGLPPSDSPFAPLPDAFPPLDLPL